MKNLILNMFLLPLQKMKLIFSNDSGAFITLELLSTSCFLINLATKRAQRRLMIHSKFASDTALTGRICNSSAESIIISRMNAKEGANTIS